MRINPTGLNGLALTPQSVDDSKNILEGTPVAEPANVASFAPSSQFLQLVNLVRQQPEIRPDRIEAVRQNILDGAYNTPQSAEATASSMLSSCD